MKAIVDDKIPYISKAIESVADEVVYAPGREFTRDLVKDADLLVVRTRTKCGKELLEGSNVKFIATATIGYDHIDTEYCSENGIKWANCPGCNAGGVEQYVQSALILLSEKHCRSLKGMTIGIVGVGNVGSRIADMASKMGLNVMLCDPPRRDRECNDIFCSLEQIKECSDIITFHVPLIRDGKYRTYHYADDSFFAGVKDNCWIINTSRGEVVDTKALKNAINRHLIADAVIDVWENEPDIDLELLGSVFIGTPHIAGYSADGKANASRMSMDNICRFFGVEGNYRIEAPAPENKNIEAKNMNEALLKIYNPLSDCNDLRANPENFEKLRGNYRVRREKSAFVINIKD